MANQKHYISLEMCRKRLSNAKHALRLVSVRMHVNSTAIFMKSDIMVAFPMFVVM